MSLSEFAKFADNVSTTDNYDELFGTPEKMLRHIEFFSSEKSALRKKNAFLTKVLWYLLVVAKADEQTEV